MQVDNVIMAAELIQNDNKTRYVCRSRQVVKYERYCIGLKYI